MYSNPQPAQIAVLDHNDLRPCLKQTVLIASALRVFKSTLTSGCTRLAAFSHLFGLSGRSAHSLSDERRHLYFQFTPFIIRRVFEMKPRSILLKLQISNACWNREYFLTCRNIALILQEKNGSDVLAVREKSKTKQTDTLPTL